MNLTKDFHYYVNQISGRITPRSNFRCEKYTPIEKCTRILKQINEIEKNLDVISSMSKKSSPFNDTHLKFSTISGNIKQSLVDCEEELELIRKKDLANFVGSKYERVVIKNTLELLKSRIGDLTMKFKKFLQGQTEIIKKIEQRRSNLTGAKPKSGKSQNEYSYSSLPTHENDEIIEIGYSTQATMQANNDKSKYYQERVSEVQSIEKTMNDLSGMMQRLGQMTYEQRFMIEKIDNNTDHALSNVEAGLKEVIKINTSVKNNRWLLIKIFLIIIITAVVYILLFTSS